MSLPGAWNQMSLHFRDANGRQERCFISLYDQTDAVPAEVEAIADAYQAASDAHLFAVQWQTTKVYPTPIYGSGAYRTCRDAAVMLAAIEANRTYPRYRIPAPKEELFASDHFTMDKATGLFTDLSEALVGVAGTTSAAITAIKRGWRDGS